MSKATLDALDATSETPHWRSWLADEKAGLIACLLENAEGLIGYGLAGPMRLGDRPDNEIQADSELYALYIHPAYQRQGHGRHLFMAMVERLVGAYYQSAGSWMMGGNHKAEHFFEKMGGLEVGKRVDIRNGRIAYREKAWCWRDLKQVQARLTLRTV
ncbi:GNAT family N-acetyltransferase [Cohaesibacter celericrescens]